ncbi:MAG: LuxR family transcriptional regulator [bacterium]|nr:MAG: LuxR family transcriptional regulator [bacterium]
MGIRILVIDDMPAITMLMSEYLSDQGYEVITAENGQEGLELMELTPISLIICDVMMPKMGGFEFIERCRKISSHIPIIVVSAKSGSNTRSIVSELGANGFLEKPINLEILSRLVTSTLASQLKKNNIIPPDTVNQRTHQRVPFFCEAHFQGESVSGVTVTTSISRGGCNLEIQSVLPVGALLLVKIKLHPGHTITAVGSVCYSIPKSGVGLRFLSLDEESERLIDSIVSTIANMELFDLEYRDHTGKLIDTFVNKFDQESNFSYQEKLV